MRESSRDTAGDRGAPVHDETARSSKLSLARKASSASEGKDGPCLHAQTRRR